MYVYYHILQGKCSFLVTKLCCSFIVSQLPYLNHRRKAEAGKGHGDETTKKSSGQAKEEPTTEFNAQVLFSSSCPRLLLNIYIFLLKAPVVASMANANNCRDSLAKTSE